MSSGLPPTYSMYSHWQLAESPRDIGPVDHSQQSRFSFPISSVPTSTHDIMAATTPCSPSSHMGITGSPSDPLSKKNQNLTWLLEQAAATGMQANQASSPSAADDCIPGNSSEVNLRLYALKFGDVVPESGALHMPGGSEKHTKKGQGRGGYNLWGPSAHTMLPPASVAYSNAAAVSLACAIPASQAYSYAFSSPVNALSTMVPCSDVGVTKALYTYPPPPAEVSMEQISPDMNHHAPPTSLGADASALGRQFSNKMPMASFPGDFQSAYALSQMSQHSAGVPVSLPPTSMAMPSTPHRQTEESLFSLTPGSTPLGPSVSIGISSSVPVGAGYASTSTAPGTAANGDSLGLCFEQLSFPVSTARPHDQTLTPTRDPSVAPGSSEDFQTIPHTSLQPSAHYAVLPNSGIRSGSVAGSRPRINIACDFCRRRKLRCDYESPCKHCVRRGHDCTRVQEVRRRGPGKKRREALMKQRDEELAERHRMALKVKMEDEAIGTTFNVAANKDVASNMVMP